MKLAALLLATAGLASAAAQSYAPYALKEGRFSCQVPKGWGTRRDVAVEAREKAFGVFLTGPRSADGVAIKLDLRFYAPGNAVFGKPEDFMKANLQPDPIPRKGEKAPKVEKTTVAGLPARRFSRKSFEYVPPSSMDTKEIPVTEEVVLVEAKEGFYAMTYSGPDSLFAKNHAAFEKVLKSFRPTP
jgi:hypothetical protein